MNMSADGAPYGENLSGAGGSDLRVGAVILFRVAKGRRH